MVIIIGFFIVILNYAATPINPNGNKAAVIVDIPTGSSFVKTTEILNKAGLIKSRFLFYCLAFTKGATNAFRAGEYQLSDSMTPVEIIDKLLSREIKLYHIAIPENLTTKEIAERLVVFKFFDKETFLTLAIDHDFLNTLGIKAKSIEGYLFPENYIFDSSMDTRLIMKIMVHHFWKRVTPEMMKGAEELGFDINQFVTFASIVGKATDNRAEKPLISAVFHNRLKKGMRLQSDATAVYELENINGKITKNHLKRNSPYNTYMISGLPPSPIANPGIDSLNAVLYPAKVDYLYFVSKGDGSNYFSSSLEMHNRAINYYRHNKN